MRPPLCISIYGLLVALILCLTGVSLADNVELSPAEGVERYKDLVRLHPQNAAYQNTLGYYHLRASQLQDAEARFRKAIQLDQSHAIAHNNLGVVYLNQGRPEKAEIQFREAVNINTHYSKAQYNLAVALFRQNLYAEAAAAYLKAKRMDSKYVEQRDNKEKMKKALDQVVDDNRDHQNTGRMK
jgi:tetratricopeptide (TPR) repeat protein